MPSLPKEKCVFIRFVPIHRRAPCNPFSQPTPNRLRIFRLC
jgi:hypothetical protein